MVWWEKMLFRLAGKMLEKKTKRKAHNTSIVNEATFKDLTRKNRCHEDVGRIGLISGRQPQAKARASPRISTRSPALVNDCNILSRPKSTACNSRSEREWRRGEWKGTKNETWRGRKFTLPLESIQRIFLLHFCLLLSAQWTRSAHGPQTTCRTTTFPVSRFRVYSALVCFCFCSVADMQRHILL